MHSLSMYTHQYLNIIAISHTGQAWHHCYNPSVLCLMLQKTIKISAYSCQQSQTLFIFFHCTTFFHFSLSAFLASHSQHFPSLPSYISPIKPRLLVFTGTLIFVSFSTQFNLYQSYLGPMYMSCIVIIFWW